MSVIKIGVDPSEVDTDFPIADADTYVCNITSQEQKTSKKDKPMLVFGLTPQGQVQAQVGDKRKAVEGKELFKYYVSLAPNALFNLKALSVACGNAGWRGGEVFPEEFLGKTIKCQISKNQNTETGRWFNQVEQIFAA